MSDDGMNGTGVESEATMMEQLEKVFGQLEAHRLSTSVNFVKWEDIKEHFHNLELAIKEKVDELDKEEKEFEEKKSESCAIISDRESAVRAKEQALVDRLQELKDAAVTEIIKSREKYKVSSPKLDDVGSKGDKVSFYGSADMNEPITVRGEKHPDKKSGHLQSVLKQLCEQMDSQGLIKFLSDNRKSLVALREELPVALKSATELPSLVLDALQGFYHSDQPASQANDKDTALQALRRSCLLLIESASPLLAISEPGADSPISSEIRQQAKAIADQWKPNLACLDVDASNHTLEAQAFLQLLATFGVASEFDEDELCKIVLPLSRRRQTPELCRSLGLTHKMPDLVGSLVELGKQIDAVHFAYAFQLTDIYPSVPLLKAYLDNLEQSGQETTNGSTIDSSIQAIADEMTALRSAIKCIEEYKLQDELPVEPLQRKLAQLEKTRANKKRAAEAANTRAKKPRAGGFGYPPYRQPASSAFEASGSYYGTAERYPYPTAAAAVAAAAAAPAYQPPSRGYEIAGHGSYGSQVTVQRHYQYPGERTVPPSATYSAPPYSYEAGPTRTAAYHPSSTLGSYLSSASQNPASHKVGDTGYLSSSLQPSSASQGIYSATGYQAATPSNYGNYTGGGSSYTSHQSYM